MKELKFPKGFLWGSATSSYQVEGGINNSDWSQFFDAGRACDHYNRFEEDFDLLKKLNQTAYRFSIEWSRIEPEEGKFDEKEIEHYREMLEALKRRNIVPFVTLYHWPVPLWFRDKGGWLNSQSPIFFERYVEKVVGSLKDYVGFWVTINEPLIYAAHSYTTGEWPPQEKSLLKSRKVLKRLIESHKRAYEVIHKLDKEAEVSIAKNYVFYEPYGNKLINKFLVWAVNRIWNDSFLKDIKNELDFIGMNHYFHTRVRFNFSHPKNWINCNENKVITDLGWEVCPESIYWALKEAAKFKKPIYITENGLADAKDNLRKDFIKDYLCQLHKAIEDGVDVRGYLHWSLMDNLEWSHGFKPRFGLIEIDYNTLERKMRPSALYYSKICKENKVVCG